VKRALLSSLFVLVGVSLFGSDANAAGFALDVQSARGTGMGSAVTAFINDSSAIFYNPAGIAQGKGFEGQAGVMLIAPTFKFTDRSGESTSTKFEIVPPVHAYAAAGITDDLSIGVGVFTPFGLDLAWPDDWAGRRQITSASLRTFDINPTAAYRFGPVRLGAGVQVVRGTVHLQRRIAFGETEGATDLGAGTWGVGGNVGLQVEAVKQVLSFGAHYRSAVKLDFDGLSDFQNVPPSLQNAIHDQAVSTSLVTPDSFAIGGAVRPIPKLIVDAEVVWIGWGSFRAINLTFPDDASNTLSSSRPKSWSNTVNYHLGAEGDLTDAIRLRGGALFDPSPSPQDTLTPDIPDASRLNLALGGGYHHPGGFFADLGYQFLILFKRESTAPEFPGSYGGLVNILGVSLGYRSPRGAKTDPAPAPATMGKSSSATTAQARSHRQ
jgi:long-chain fatty acid transport protein